MFFVLSFKSLELFTAMSMVSYKNDPCEKQAYCYRSNAGKQSIVERTVMLIDRAYRDSYKQAGDKSDPPESQLKLAEFHMLPFLQTITKQDTNCVNCESIWRHDVHEVSGLIHF